MAAMAPVWKTNATFDAFNQPVTVLGPDGTTPVAISISDVMVLQQSAVGQSISQGIQLGAALMLLLTLVLITNKEKRRSCVFLFNAAALFLVALRAILSLVAYTGPLFNFYRWETMYYNDIGSAQAVSAAGEFISLLLIVVIEISLAMQVRIVCCNLATFQQLAVNTINVVTTITVIGLRFALMVVNITWNIEGLTSMTEWQFKMINRFAAATNITLVISIGISTVIFCAKLGFAIESRRSLGLKQFGPMQIIFVIGCQTMCTPLIFTIVAYFAVKNAQLTSVPPTIVAISLPLSAMWATANTNNRHAASSDRRAQIPLGGSDFAKKPGGKGSYYTDTETTGTLVGDSPRKGHFEGSVREGEREQDLEMQSLGRERGLGVQVERAFSESAQRNARRVSDTICTGPVELSVDRNSKHSGMEIMPVGQQKWDGAFF
ncbi:pheromone alpha factor receptor [Saxophila tyrrhenica]|uniref:Pheromone alpha factor receptor n=1 Tax=Saxophila tyrrhenica TaxID=1690608 RepID=A0AAV9PB09_9PEZI|nr:pheromone alpha factor receptor [Saxophila tyrrhenica]